MSFVVILINFLVFFSLKSFSFPTESVVPFFRTPQSPLSSGFKSTEDLEKKAVGSQTTELLQVERDKLKFWAPRDLFALSTDFDSDNAYGIAQILVSTGLRRAPAWKSDVILNLVAGSKATVVDWEAGWTLLDFQGARGWVEAGSLICKYDFVESVYWKNYWLQVKYRGTDHLNTDPGGLISIKELFKQKAELRFKPSLAIAVRNEESLGVRLRNHVSVLDQKLEEWKSSDLQGHGLIFWKKETRAVLYPFIPKHALSNAELLQREVTAVAFHPENDKMALASSNGVWLTTDMETWTRLEFFKDQDYPVAISREGQLLVGHHLSEDHGRTFTPILKWDEVARRFESETGRGARQLKIRSVGFARATDTSPATTRNKLLVRMLLDSGVEEFVLVLNPGDPQVRHWKFQFGSAARALSELKEITETTVDYPEKTATSSRALSSRAQPGRSPSAR